jgi:hypothetical protein
MSLGDGLFQNQTILQTNQTKVEVNLLNFALVDGQTVNVQYQFVSSSGSVELVIEFPSFHANLSYDPSMAVLLPSSSNGGQSSDGGVNLGLAVALPVCLGVAFLVVVMAIVGTLLVFAWRMRRIRLTRRSTVWIGESEERGERL